jgi:hypothetical protein
VLSREKKGDTKRKKSQRKYYTVFSLVVRYDAAGCSSALEGQRVYSRSYPEGTGLRRSPVLCNTKHAAPPELKNLLFTAIL